MANLSFLPDQWMVGLGTLLLLSTAVILVVNKRQREAVLGRLHFQRRRTSGASTPPRSISPSKKAPTNGAPDFVNAFPPSRRSVLPELAKTLPSAASKKLLSTEPSGNFLVKHALPTTQTYSLDNEVPKYTPTGFSTAEIKAMGDFPAYDILSGVPLPQAYKNFDVTRALPRPYRPLRWKYHQTMCKSGHSSPST